MKFEELKFRHITELGGVQARIQFTNGFGASVVKHRYSYGGPEGFYELAVLDREGRLTYSTPITDDVIGWLTPEKVEALLMQIEALPSTRSADQ